MKSVGTPMLLVELENRGYQDEVDRFVKKWESTFRFEDINDHKSLMRDFKRVWQFTKLDTGKYMDAMWQLLEEYPNNGDIAHELVQYRTMCRIFDIDGIEDFDRWVAKNPDKFAKALRIVLDTCSDPATAKRDLEVDLIPDYSKKDLAFRMMLFLPEATFNKHFANLDSKYFTKSAYLTGNHFKAKWAFGKQQQAFYDRYSNRN